ncbi:MAG TPA: hypothetical protein VHO25_23145, partial [Polyangiaceae bacterium]|nr:hypothetical protein [Polyangiaceae bacterium]
MATDAGNTDDAGILDAGDEASLVDSGDAQLMDAGCMGGTWQLLSGDQEGIASADASDLVDANLSFGPTENGSRIWIDQHTGVNFPPHLQRWGQVFTAPVTQGPMLLWTSFYLRPSNTDGATYFKVRLTRWSDAEPGPIGATLYESEPVFFATPNPNPAAASGNSPTIVEVNT